MGLIFLGFNNNAVFLGFVLLVYSLFTVNYLLALASFLLMLLFKI
ncbi:MAG: hypothetical protein V1717_01070 [Candidatus Micrarchaeota archaeon]